MKPVVDSCMPKTDVLTGSIDDAVFAADLYAVYSGRAPPIYGDAQVFFDNTYPTEGLKELLSEVFGRLSGAKPDASSVIKLETSLGGGKTHSLIALYHAARSGKTVKNISQIINDDVIPRENVHVAVLAGLEYGASGTGRTGAVSPRTLWGELAYQLGGREGYDLVKEADKEWQAPGGAAIDKVFDLCGEPVLILIDELAAYLAGIKPGGKNKPTNNLEAVAVFLQQLLQTASRRKRVVVVFSLTGKGDIYGEETELILSKVERVASRSARSISPSRENEIVSVIKKRLFEKIDENEAKKAASEYLEYYRSQERMGIALPHHAVKTEFKNQLENSYPFHPELLSILDNKLSTIPNFNRTRGALRLLVKAVRHYYENKEVSGFIMPYHISLDDKSILDELTGRLDRERFRPVIQNDIYSMNNTAKAQEIDAGRKHPVAQMTATTILLNSLVEGQPGGVDKPTIYMATITPEITDETKFEKRFTAVKPGIKPEDVDQALEELEDKCWYLYENGGRCVFKSEWNINKVIADEVNNVGLTEAKERIETTAKKKFNSTLLNTIFFPSAPADVPDDEKLKLIVIHWDSETTTRGSPPPDLVSKLYDKAGQTESFRVYRNTTLFLVAESNDRQSMINNAKRSIALERITANKELSSTMTPEQRSKLEEKSKESGLGLLTAIVTAYRYLYYPSSTDEQTQDLRLRQLPLKVDEVADFQKLNHQDMIIKALENEGKLIRNASETISPEYVFDRVWNQGEASISTLEFKRRFDKKPSLPIIFNVDVAKNIIRTGVEKGSWVYQDSSNVYEKGSHPVPIQIDAQAFLLLPDEARKRGVTAFEREEEAEEKCPICGNPTDECTCAPQTVAKVRLSGEGDVERAFTQLLEAANGKVKSFKELSVKVKDMQGLRALGLLAPQLGKAKVNIDLSCNSQGEGKPTLTLAFKGDWDSYADVKQFLENASKRLQFTSSDAEFRVSFTEPVEASPDGVKHIKDNLKKFGANSVALSAEPGE